MLQPTSFHTCSPAFFFPPFFFFYLYSFCLLLYLVYMQLLAFMELNIKCWEMHNFGKYSFFSAQVFCCCIIFSTFTVKLSCTWSKFLGVKERCEVVKEKQQNMD